MAENNYVFRELNGMAKVGGRLSENIISFSRDRCINYYPRLILEHDADLSFLRIIEKFPRHGGRKGGILRTFSANIDLHHGSSVVLFFF